LRIPSYNLCESFYLNLSCNSSISAAHTSSSSFYRLILLRLCIPASLHIRHGFSLHHYYACSSTCVYTILTLVLKAFISYPLVINHGVFCVAVYIQCLICKIRSYCYVCSVLCILSHCVVWFIFCV
jgi:hypothetical protein